ncbi:MAG: hypothetical protein LC776_18605 [Acidobacteria bacterium]|nr:hypothetical protein [Acidobacteriota bacterium]
MRETRLCALEQLGAFLRGRDLEWLHQPAYADLSPRTVFAMLLDAGRRPARTVVLGHHQNGL